MIAGTKHAFKVDAVVLIKTLVLDGYKGLAEIIRQLVHGFDTETVGVGADILVDLISGTVVDNGGLTGCHNGI